jgi:hypothetical protein
MRIQIWSALNLEWSLKDRSRNTLQGNSMNWNRSKSGIS